ncbi:MAG: uroporphyrinogen decarboxylase, partial [Micropepsaceae bacterium]
MMNSGFNSHFLSVFERSNLKPPPIWLMRQAGRYLPEYQEVRKKADSFWTMCMTPDLSVEVTLQPIKRFDFDAAIIFSDILVIPHALGQKVRFEDGVGPIIEPLSDVGSLIRDKTVWRDKLSPVYEALKNTRETLAEDKALIGFAGAPWTLAAYMLEGRGTKDQGSARLYAYRNRDSFSELLDLLSDAVATHLICQLEAGANVVQIFDSWAGGLPEDAFRDWVIAPTKRAVATVRRKYPKALIIGFPRQATQSGLESFVADTNVDAVSIDTATAIKWAVGKLGSDVVLQGNLDPLTLVAGGEVL